MMTRGNNTTKRIGVVTMSKVKITQEQADLIEQFKRNFKGFGREVLFETLDGHYEIKERFKVGDYVMDNNLNSGIITKIVEDIAKVSVWVSVKEEYFEETFLNVYIDQLSFLEEKEIEAVKEVRFWRSNNRDVWHIKRHDILKNDVGNSFEVNGFHGSGKNQKVLFKPGNFDFMNNVKDLYEIVCFAEDRQDL